MFSRYRPLMIDLIATGQVSNLAFLCEVRCSKRRTPFTPDSGNSTHFVPRRRHDVGTLKWDGI